VGSGPVHDLHELDRLDAELRARADRLQTLDAEVASTRERAEAIDEFFAGYPDADTRLRQLLAEAQEELTDRRGERERAQERHDRARDEESRRLAARTLERAVDHAALAETRVARARSLHDSLEGEASALPAELERLAAHARTIAAELGDVPAPGDGPHALVEWASRAHATIFVATGSVDTQRERVIREANELGSLLLGEPTYGSTVAQVRTRVDAALE
jgi:DNA repair exonuclease SbcCD ATPase subunit